MELHNSETCGLVFVPEYLIDRATSNIELKDRLLAGTVQFQFVKLQH